MRTRQTTVITFAFTLALVLTSLTLNTPLASAHATRELTGSFGHFVEPEGIAVDLETGNVYVAEPKTNTVDIFNATGGPPAGGVPTQMTGLLFDTSDRAGVAVDNSCYEHEPKLTGKACEEYDPAYGDVYAVDSGTLIEFTESTGKMERTVVGPSGLDQFKFNAGKYEKIREIRTLGYPPSGVTVDSQGNAYAVSTAIFDCPVAEFKKTIEKITSGGKEEFEENLEEIDIPQSIALTPAYVAVDDRGGVYVGQGYETNPARDLGVAKLSLGTAGEVLSEGVFAPYIEEIFRPVAVDRATGDVFVGDGGYIAEYDAAGGLQLEFGSSEPVGGSLASQSAVTGIAVNSETDRVYVANSSGGDVDVFGPFVEPPTVPGGQPRASDLTRTSALLAGVADPEGSGGSYYYEYVPAGEYEPGAADPYVAGGQTAHGALAAGHTDESIERVTLTGLRPGTAYHYRLVVSNASATAYGPDQTFTTAPSTPPTVSTGVAVEVGPTSATLTGTVGPRGLPTSYVFEVGTDTGYAGARLFGDAGVSTAEVSVAVGLRYLVPGTTYHYRLVASSFDGTTYGQDGAFTTPGVASPVAQPSGTPLIASPAVGFPSIVGAITKPVRGARPRKALTGAQKLAAALRVCKSERPAKRRASCETRARDKHKRAGVTNHSKKE
jgi:DNA-binding beta-propeller fold protein YncE